MSANGVQVYRIWLGLRLWAGFCLTLGLGSLSVNGVEFLVRYSGAPNATHYSLKENSDWSALGGSGLIVGGLLTWYGLRRLRMSLVVSAKGLEYHGLGTDICVGWRKVESLGPVNWGGWGAVEGLRLRGRADGKGIPLELFAPDWPDSPLSATIAYYLPHLNDPPAPPPVPAVPLRRRNHRAPAAPAPRPAMPRARSAITRRLRPLRSSQIGTGPPHEQEEDTVRF